MIFDTASLFFIYFQKNHVKHILFRNVLHFIGSDEY